jgi:hypothetical protein
MYTHLAVKGFVEGESRKDARHGVHSGLLCCKTKSVLHVFNHHFYTKVF